MDKIAVENDLDIYRISRNMLPRTVQGASENAIKALMKYGIDLSGHRTQPNGGPYKAMRFNPNNDRGTQANT